MATANAAGREVLYVRPRGSLPLVVWSSPAATGGMTLIVASATGWLPIGFALMLPLVAGAWWVTRRRAVVVGPGRVTVGHGRGARRETGAHLVAVLVPSKILLYDAWHLQIRGGSAVVDCPWISWHRSSLLLSGTGEERPPKRAEHIVASVNQVLRSSADRP